MGPFFVGRNMKYKNLVNAIAGLIDCAWDDEEVSPKEILEDVVVLLKENGIPFGNISKLDKERF